MALLHRRAGRLTPKNVGFGPGQGVRGLFVNHELQQVRKTPSWPRSWANFSFL
jgi:hypothetical protein